jgi:cytochrome c oxidase subunit 4
MTTEPRSTPTTTATSATGLLFTLAGLLVLAAASLGFRFAHLGPGGVVVAMVIAVTKAVLVAVFFMEIGGEKPSVRFAFVAGIVLVALLLSLTVADVVTRGAPPLTAPPGMAQRDVG